MERLKEFITPNRFSIYGYIVAVSYPICGTVLSAVTVGLRAVERRNIHCNVGSKSPLDKNYIQASCFDQYDQQYNSPLPLYGFTILSFAVLTIICIVYSWCCVKSRVEEVEQKCNNPGPLITITTHKVYICYLAQLSVRIFFGSLFIILQKFILYPCGFPTGFECELKPGKSKSTETTSNKTTFTNSSLMIIDCQNSMGSDKAVWEMIVLIVNIILICLAVGEVMFLRCRACQRSAFRDDTEFCQTYFFNKRKTPRSVEQIEMIQRRRIDQFTKEEEPLIPSSPGKNEGYKNLDDIYVDLIIHTGRARYHVDMAKMNKLEIMEEYVKSPLHSIRINKLEELLLPNEDSNDPHKILVFGSPGIGKTFLCKKLLRDLSKGEIPGKDKVRKFHFMFLFNFRNFNSEELKSMSLETLFRHGQFSGGKLNDEVFQYMQAHPNEILLVFDGLDELKDHGRCTEDEKKYPGNGVEDVMPISALYVKLVKDKLLSGATVITTTRPYAMDSLEGMKFDRAVEILGFSPDKVEEYCTKFFKTHKSTMDKVWQHIESNLNLLYLCYIPVNCFIVCSLLEKIIELSNCLLLDVTYLPTTLTDIYKGALRMFIFKHHPDYQDKTLKRKDLTDGNFSSSVDETLLKLESLAVKGIYEMRLVFDLEEVKGMENCGLLNRLPDVETAKYSYKPQFCFIHLRMQEFVAARGIAKRNCEEIKEFLSSILEDQKWHLVIQFVAGLLRDKVTIAKDIFVDLFDDALSQCLPYGVKNLVVMKCLHELNDTSSVERAAAKLESNNQFTSEIDFRFCGVTSVDCTAIVYVLKHFDTLQHLDLTENPLGHGGCLEISKLLEGGGPELLVLSKCIIPDSGLFSLLEAIKKNPCRLTKLSLSGCSDITDDGFSYLCDALVCETCKLTELDFGGAHLGLITDVSISRICAALTHENCKLIKLSLGGSASTCSITNEGVSKLQDAFMHENCKLKELTLCRKNNHTSSPDGAHCIYYVDDSIDCVIRRLNSGVKVLTKKGVSGQYEEIELYHVYKYDSECFKIRINREV